MKRFFIPAFIAKIAIEIKHQATQYTDDEITQLIFSTADNKKMR